MTKHKVWLDHSAITATFPLYNLSGQLAGFQQYKPLEDKLLNNHPRDCRYFTYLNRNMQAFWGAEVFSASNTLFLTEGIFDACRLTKRGVSAIAVLSNNPKPLLNFLTSLDRPVVAVCDNGAAGKKLAKYGTTSVTVPEEYGDLGDAPEEYVTYLLDKYL